MAVFPDAFIAPLAAGVVAAVGGVAWYFNQENRWRRRLAQLPATRIADIHDGPVKLVGRAYPIGPIIPAPFSERGCIGYEATVVERRGRRSVTRLAVTRCNNFILRDETGEAIIMAGNCEPIFVIDRHYASNLLTPVEPKVEAFLRSRNIDPQGFLFRKSLMCREGLFEEGEELVVCGRARREVDPSPAKVDDYRGVPTRILVSGDDRERILISDKPTLVAEGRRATQRP